MSTQTTLHQYGVLTRRQRQKVLQEHQKSKNQQKLKKAEKKKKRYFGQELTNQNVSINNAKKASSKAVDKKPILKKQQKKKKIIIEENNENCDAPNPMEITPVRKKKATTKNKHRERAESTVAMTDVSDEEEEEEEDEDKVLLACDESTKNDPLHCADKINTITKKFFEAEKNHHTNVDADYMTKHDDLQPRMRRILLEWIDEVHFKFKLRSEVLYMAIAMIDRFLSKKAGSEGTNDGVMRSQLQLIGCTCLWIASKYHEIYAPAMADFVHMSADAFSTDDMLEMEEDLLQTLEFNIVIPTPLTFAQRFLKAATYGLSHKEHAKRVYFLTLYMMELSVMRYDLLKYKPSQIAAACTFCAVTMTGYSRWHNDLIKVTTYKAKDLKDLIRCIQNFVFSKELLSKHRFVKKKYSKTRYAKVGLLQPRKRTRNQSN